MAIDGTQRENSAFDLPAHFNGRLLSGEARTRWRGVLLARVALVGFLLALAFDGTRLGLQGDLLANALMFSVAPWHVLLLVLSARDEAMPWYVAFADAAILAATSTLVASELWAPILLAAPTIVAVEAAVAGRSWGLAAAGWSTGCFALAGAVVEVPYLAALITAVALASLTTAILVGQITHEHTTARMVQEDLLSRVPALVWEAGPDGARFVRGRLRELLGYTRVEWAQIDSFVTLIHPDDVVVLANTGDLGPGDERIRQFRVKRRDDSWLWLSDHISAAEDATGRLLLQGVSRDISTERDAIDSAARLRGVLGRISTPIHTLAFDSSRRTLHAIEANDAARDIDLTDPSLIALARRAIDSGEQIISLDGGYEVWPIGPLHVAVMFPTTREAPDPQHRDPLTALPDRGGLRTEMHRLLTADPATRLALLVLDLNQFKEVNDTLGHAQGDELLRAVAGRLTEVAMEGDLVCRLGGDEFALLLVHEGPERAQLVAADVETAIAHPIVLDGVYIQAGVSIGAAFSPEHGDDADLLLQRADVAMYQAKSANETFRKYDPLDDRFTMRRLKLLGELPRAINEGELCVHYQPKIDLHSNTVIGVEALVRWNHPDHGMVPPDEFIELAEVSGLVRELTRQVLETSVEQLCAWDDEGIHLTAAVNLSVRNFSDADLPIFVEQCLERFEIEPTRLTLEITESEVMDDVVLALSVLERLNSLGVHSSIDDFGTGYSSLAYLRQLPIDEIKIDRSFVGTMAVNQNDTVIVRSIIELGHNLDLDVVAEGVEDEWTLESLRNMGCDQAQGYYFSKPVPGDQIADFIHNFVESPVG